MKEEKLFRAIGLVGDDLIARADAPVKRKTPVRWAGLAALAACCLIAVGLARLVTMQMGNTKSADSAAPESNMMSLTTADSAVEAPAEAAEAPAFDAAAPESAADSTDGAAETQTARKNAALTLGPLTLGMSGDEIQDILGAPDDESNSGPVEYEDGSLRVCWFYRIDNAPDQLNSVKLDLADFGDGWQLDEVMIWPNVGWKTAEGIGIGSTEDEVRAAYPEAEVRENTLMVDDAEVTRTYFVIGEGRTKLTICMQDGSMIYLDIGTFFEEPPFKAE